MIRGLRWLIFQFRHIHTMWFHYNLCGDLYCPKCKAIFQEENR